ncbi:iron ABC transporter permease [Fertoebacter nigrum]|uniref:Iron ABC transporter permease n=1 Tax=Fertoeibacter niger TaxID=2656921 RepID=A0A8X8GYT0_9RHOB|nr:iron ABC transporter permease [Fertoeibacter niger]NUB45597.1 iron ABC transporter permease [Fertoeibacter niger]
MPSDLRAAPAKASGLRRLFGEPLLLTLLVLAAIGLFILPLAAVGRLALFASGGGVDAFAAALSSRSVQRALWHSLESAALSAALAVVVGGGLGLLIGLSDLRGRVALSFAILMLMMIPPHVTAIAWMQMLGPSSVLLQMLGTAPPPGSTNPLYSREGVIALLALQQVPIVYLTLRAALRALPRDLAEAARVNGAGPWLLLRRVILPLMGPAFLAGFALAFVAALGNFGVPALLGIPGRYVTLPVLMWQRLASSGPSVLADLAVLATLIGGIAVLAVWAQMRLARGWAVALIGPAQQPLRLSLGRARPLVEGGLWALLALLLLAPLLAMLATALVPTYGVPLNAATATLRHFHEVIFTQSVTARAFANSAGLAVLAGALVAGLALATGALLRGPAAAGARGIATLAEIAYALPGLVISIAFIIAFIKPLPLIGVSLYGTHAIILGAYLAAFLAVGLKPVGVAFAALDPALQEAARVSGAGFWRRFWRIDAPLAAPAAASGAVLVMLTAWNEVTLSSILWTRGTETLGTVIFNYEDGGYSTLAAAMSVISVLATLLLMLALHWLGRNLPPGIIPWRG